MGSKEQTDQELIGSAAPDENTAADSWEIDGIGFPLTPLQFHSLSLLQRLIALKNSYQTDPQYEKWLMAAINKSIYSTLRDCMEANVGDQAKELLHEERQVN